MPSFLLPVKENFRLGCFLIDRLYFSPILLLCGLISISFKKKILGLSKRELYYPIISSRDIVLKAMDFHKKLFAKNIEG
tara:strand:+ start:115 stop:351 length:237 start_codon:yes stop_codon:yes gene_type:complete